MALESASNVSSASSSEGALTNRVKSIFIGFYPMLAMGIVAYAAWQIARGADLLVWAGVAATSLPFLVFIGVVMATKPVARTSSSLPWLGGTAMLGVALAAYAAAPEAIGIAVLGTVGVLLYALWYSRLGRTASAELAVGRALPELGLRRLDGTVLETSELRGKPALLMFYRGNWCPLCMAQVKEIAARYREIASTGARVLLISPQPHTNTQALAKRFDVPFDFLTDEGNVAARILRIEMKNGLPMGMGMLGYEADTVFPTVVVLDANGIVRFVDQTDNYRVRPEPDTFLPLLKSLSAADAG